MQDEKRSAIRVPLKARGRMMHGASEIELRSTDIGSDGAGIECDVALPMGATVTLALRFYHDGAARSIDATGRVAHCVCNARGFKIGLAFVSLPLAARQTILALTRP